MRHPIAKFLAQVFVFGLVLAIAVWMFYNAKHNLGEQGIASGFSFLDAPAGFNIIFHLLPYRETSTYLQAFWVALCNTLLLAGIGIVLATVIGVLIGMARRSKNWLIATLSACYIETFRNIPLLLQIFFWYFGVLRHLPLPRDSFAMGKMFFLNNRGFYLPKLFWSEGLQIEYPVLEGFNFVGGFVIIPELAAMILALSIYTASFIAEIVRAGIESVPKGQTDAAYALGLHPKQTMRLIILPQALRVILPPLTSQYLNLTKNTSLAAAIAYPDLVSVFAGTVLNQTGQAIEVISITMATYLLISLSIAGLMHWYHKKTILLGT